jgi:hypothetical protein
MAQTWHQLRPGEVRNDCGGCHAHSQKPTPFEKTAAAGKDYKVWNLTAATPLVTSKARDESKTRWDEDDQSGLRFARGVQSVEFQKDVRPILERSCVACHTRKWDKPAGNLVLDGPEESIEGRKFPGDYFRLAVDERGRYGYKPVGYDSWGYPQASRYIRKFQSRRSVLIWKVYGQRLDGFSNDDHPSESPPGSGVLLWKGKPVEVSKFRHRVDLDYTGSVMPPPEAVAGSWKAPDGSLIKVAPLSDEDRRTLVRWIDLGCPLDLDFDPEHPERRGFGFHCDDNRPVLTLTEPGAGRNPEMKRILVGMYDYLSGLDQGSFHVAADFEIEGRPAGKELADLFLDKGDGVYELRLRKPITRLPKGTLTVSVKDRQGNVSVIERRISVGR